MWGPLKSGAWGGRPTCHPQTPPLLLCHEGITHSYLGTRQEVRGEIHATAAIPPVKQLLVPIEQEAGSTAELVWMFLDK